MMNAFVLTDVLTEWITTYIKGDRPIKVWRGYEKSY